MNYNKEMARLLDERKKLIEANTKCGVFSIENDLDGSFHLKMDEINNSIRQLQDNYE
jgi:hypothetical protein